jgi:hypothetical protein
MIARHAPPNKVVKLGQKQACPKLLETSKLTYGKAADIAGHPQSEDAFQLARQRFHPPDNGLVV